MRLKVVAGDLIERLVLKLNAVPEPLLETRMAFSMARAIMVGVKLGIFEAAADGPCSAEAIAERRATHPRAMAKLLNTLTDCDSVLLFLLEPMIGELQRPAILHHDTHDIIRGS